MSADAHFKEIQDHKESIKWVLEQQAVLRAEFMTFYKKDLKEIYSSLDPGKENHDGEFQTKSLNDAKEMFNKFWGRSYDLITPKIKKGQ